MTTATTVRTVHGADLPAPNGRTVIEYRNGFCNDMHAYPSTAARDGAVRRLRENARERRATCLQYVTA